MFNNVYQGKTVLLTGHTGFKGAWLCEWLLSLGARVVGYALDPQPHEMLFDQLHLGERLAEDHRADVLDIEEITRVVKEVKPDVIFHLAAQPLVQLSYDQPVETFATNVMGTAHLLEAIRLSAHSCSVVVVTSDKCYENREWLHAYREEDAMGGHDPYSASKGAAELIVSSYQKSFFSSNKLVRLASARAGNVIGGGDWAENRIVPDCVRALQKGEVIAVRNKIATRPWQHVLEPLSGYLSLGASLSDSGGAELSQIDSLRGAFNFGPRLSSNKNVLDLVEEILRILPGEWKDESDPQAKHEAGKLNLAIDKAFHVLQWKPVWGFKTTVKNTIDWYIKSQNGGDMKEYTQSQIQSYIRDAHAAGLQWSK